MPPCIPGLFEERGRPRNAHLKDDFPVQFTIHVKSAVNVHPVAAQAGISWGACTEHLPLGLIDKNR